MIDRDHDLSIVRQAKVLKLARSTVYGLSPSLHPAME
ncbi:hypothetical protein ABIF91_009768, partial [Bradyrhizobium sp. USDA 241]